MHNFNSEPAELTKQRSRQFDRQQVCFQSLFTSSKDFRMAQILFQLRFNSTAYCILRFRQLRKGGGEGGKGALWLGFRKKGYS